jgi:DNA-binding winged helix-turn-helix (wHTH) protein/tetratricopeptide (TPR) repeat protein
LALETRSPGILRFGTFEVDLRSGELRKQGVRIKLQEQPFHVLTLLLQRPGDIVTREELRSENWPADTFVDFDNSLNTAINKLREALGDSADSPRFIETLPRRGYRFIASVGSNDRKELAITARSWKIVVPVAIVVLTAVAVAGGFIWHTRKARLTEKDTIVLADFANTTGETVFDDTLKQGLRVQLEQSPFLNILSDQKVDEVLQLMGRPKDERLTQDVTREVCQRAGSKAFLIGTISSLGTHYVIGLKGLNCRTGDGLASEQVEADSREHVLKALSESATSMRKKLGESLATIQKYDAPVEVTTPSLEALKAYSLGMKTWHQKGETAALPFFRRAVELDPKFAMAYARLGRVDDPTLTAENTRKAYELRNKLSERERLYIEAHYYDSVRGDLDKAAEVYEVWQRTYPRDVEPYQNLANIYSEFGNFEKALEVAREALRLEADNEENYLSVGHFYICLNRLDEADAVYKQAEERQLESEPLLYQRYNLAFLKRDSGEMERLVATSAGKQGADSLHSWVAWAAAYHGRLRKARELFRPETEGGCQICAGLALIEAHFGETQQARADAEAALKVVNSGEDEFQWAALALALAGDVTRAEKLADELNDKFPLNTVVQRFLLPTIRATMALSRKDPGKAVELLREMSPYEFGAQCLRPIYMRGRAYLMLHDGTAAAAEFQKVIDHPGIVEKCPVGALAHLGLARAYALEGDKAESRAAYLDFLTLWKDADPDIPILREAKSEYAKLQ